MIPNNITKKHILRAIEEISLEGIRKGRRSSTYDLLYEGKSYPPKLVISIANRYANGNELEPDEFHGGKDTDTFDLLKNEGFEIVPKKDPVKSLIENYKKRIAVTKLEGEKYKWELISEFQGRPNPGAADFHQEIKGIKFKNLAYAMAIAVIHHLAKSKPEELRVLFSNLYDESRDLTNRMKSFNEETLKLYRGLGETLSHHQDERTISTYLTYHNPQKYTFYKSSFYKKYCQLLGVKEAATNQKYAHYLSLITELIENYIVVDDNLIEQVKALLPQYYDGNNHNILAQDILYQMLDSTGQDESEDGTVAPRYWLYAAGENGRNWDEFHSASIMGLGWDEMGDLKQYRTKEEVQKALIKHYGGKGSKSNDVSTNFDFANSINIGDIIIVKKGRGELLGYGVVTSEYSYVEDRAEKRSIRTVNWKSKGSWKVDFSLVLKTLTDITDFPTEDPNYNSYPERLLALMDNQNPMSPDEESHPLNTILYGPPGTGKTYNTIDKALQIVDESFYKANKHNRNALTERFRELLITDWESPAGRIAFITFHQSLSYEDFIEGIKPDAEGGDITYNVEAGIFKRLVNKALQTEVTVHDNFKQTYGRLITEINKSPDKKLVLQTLKKGKPFTIYVNSKENLRFHANTDKAFEGVIKKDYLHTYLHTGISLDWASYTSAVGEYMRETYKYDAAESAPPLDKQNHILIIDEINRGNVSQVFGELISLIEDSKRIGKDEELRAILPYSSDLLGVPQNLFILGTMNTADRSVESLDTALRRRFSFEEMMPKPELLDPYRCLIRFHEKYQGISWEDWKKKYYSKGKAFYELLGLKSMSIGSKNEMELYDQLEKAGFNQEMLPSELSASNLITEPLVNLQALLEKLNKRIETLKDRDHQVGHAYFLNIESLNELMHVFKDKIIPLLQEYFFGDYKKIQLILGEGFISSSASEIDFAVDDDRDYSESEIYFIRKEAFYDNNQFSLALEKMKI